MVIYYDSKTRNVERFISKLNTIKPEWEFIKVDECTKHNLRGHFITYTTLIGQVPEISKEFIKLNGNLLLSVTSSGNRNWGKNFGLAGDKISEELNIKLLMKFEISGTNEDVEKYINLLCDY